MTPGQRCQVHLTLGVNLGVTSAESNSGAYGLSLPHFAHSTCLSGVLMPQLSEVPSLCGFVIRQPLVLVGVLQSCLNVRAIAFALAVFLL
jgi:hypothetical protein